MAVWRKKWVYSGSKGAFTVLFLEETFEDLAVEVYLGGQEIYDYLIAVE